MRSCLPNTEIFGNLIHIQRNCNSNPIRHGFERQLADLGVDLSLHKPKNYKLEPESKELINFSDCQISKSNVIDRNFVAVKLRHKIANKN